MADDGDFVIPFGKHRGRTIEDVRAIDPSYLDWLVAQPWFRERNVVFYQKIINYHAEPTETPEHNALQARFSDTKFCLSFVDFVIDLDNEFEELREELRENVRNTLKWYKGYGYSSGDRLSEKEKEIEEKIDAINRGKMRLCISDRQYEYKSIDVEFLLRIDIDGSTYDNPEYSSWDFYRGCIFRCSSDRGTIRGECRVIELKIEIKPTIGDDYPAVLRQMRRNGSQYLFVGSYTGVGATREQFISMMESSGITVVFTSDLS